jgi:type IV pilus assembly protein PilB
LVISQRLLRRLDPAHREPVEYSPARLLAAGFREDELHGLKLYRAQRSSDSLSGYKGRIGIFQVMPVTSGLARMIAEGASEWEIDLLLTQTGVESLRRAALNKVKEGITDLDEVERVLGKPEAATARPHAMPQMVLEQADDK